MERDRAKLLQQTFAELNSAFAGQNRRAHSAQPPLVVNRVKVTFRDEPGEGSGVARSFYTSVAEVSLNGILHRNANYNQSITEDVASATSMVGF